MTIAPDTKDWTWVLNRPCSECGFDSANAAFSSIPELTRDAGRRLAVAARRPDAALRPSESTWSPHEYAAHVRDVCRIFRFRLGTALGQSIGDPSIPAFDAAPRLLDGVPLLSNWDQDATALEAGYRTQNPAVVADQVVEAADAMAALIESVEEADRGRIVRRSDGAKFTVTTLAQYFVHDLVHHVHDVQG